MPTVRLAQPRDAEAVLELVAGLGRRDVADDPEPQRQVFLDYLAFDDVIVLVAEEDSVLTGVASVWIRPRLNWTTAEAWVADLVVHPDHRRRGPATALVEACVREARRRECHRVVLESASHRDDAHAFYEAYGFVDDGRRYQLALSDGLGRDRDH